MNRKYVKPMTEVFIPKGDYFMEDVPIVNSGEFESKSNQLEFEDNNTESDLKPINLWDE